MNLITHEETLQQSKSVFAQFGESKWIPFAKENAQLPRNNATDLKNTGIGKFLLLVAMGESLEKNIDVLKKYRDRVDVICCDKAFAPMVRAGIKPDYVMICDANILYKHMEGHEADTEGVKLIATPYANVEWTRAWRGPRYFYVNKDAIQSEKIFLPIMGLDSRTIPASSNVSNAMLTFMVGADEKQNVNFAGYERYLLLGYDYSWRAAGNYYAWANPWPKASYMTHRTMLDINGDQVRTSENLFFSVRWLVSYIQNFRLPVVNCGGRGLLEIDFKNTLEKELSQINADPKRIDTVRQLFKMAQDANKSFTAAKAMFDKAREELYQWPSAIMQKSV